MTDMPLRGRDLLRIDDLSPHELSVVLDSAHRLKEEYRAGSQTKVLEGKAIAIILQKPSMRTRVSFEVACARLGAHPVVMTGEGGAFSRGESIVDTARVLERYVDAIVVRTFEQDLVAELAKAASVPVVNGLTDEHHPCQGLADLLTISEHFGTREGLRFTYLGDGNNMAHTYLLGCAMSGMEVTIACPEGFEPDHDVVARAREIAEKTGGSVRVMSDPNGAAAGAQIIATDTWASMGQEAQHDERLSKFEAFRVTEDLMDLADSSAIFMHCLPAHRGEEVTDAVMDGSRSVIYDEAENRLHAQQALLALLLAND